MKIQNISNWLLVFFIHEISEHVRDANNLLEAIQSNGCGDNSELWVLYERVEQQNGRAKYDITLSRLQPQGNTYSLEKVSGWQSREHIDRDSWKEAIAFIYGHVHSKRKILFTWSHGSGFGINVEPDDTDFSKSLHRKNESKQLELKEKRNATSYLTSEEVRYYNERRKQLIDEKSVPFHQVPTQIEPIELREAEYQIVKNEDIYDCQRIQILWMHTLASELKTALQGAKIDLLITMNCNMQLFENGYMLRDVIEVFVGPESYMWADGYAVQELFQLITLAPDISNHDLVHAIVEDYCKMHRRLGHHNYLDQTTLFANSLRTYGEICLILQQATASILASLENTTTANEIQEVINNLKKNCFYSVSGYNYLFLLDLGLWLETVYRTPELSPKNQLYDLFIELLQNTVIEKHIGQELLKSDAIGPKKYGHSGCSLFFPQDRLYSSVRRIGWCQYFSRQISSSFQKETLWDEFLNRIN